MRLYDFPYSCLCAAWKMNGRLRRLRENTLFLYLVDRERFRNVCCWHSKAINHPLTQDKACFCTFIFTLD